MRLWAGICITTVSTSSPGRRSIRTVMAVGVGCGFSTAICVENDVFELPSARYCENLPVGCESARYSLRFDCPSPSASSAASAASAGLRPKTVSHGSGMPSLSPSTVSAKMSE
jgi:hypothetical protein